MNGIEVIPYVPTIWIQAEMSNRSANLDWKKPTNWVDNWWVPRVTGGNLREDGQIKNSRLEDSKR